MILSVATCGMASCTRPPSLGMASARRSPTGKDEDEVDEDGHVRWPPYSRTLNQVLEILEIKFPPFFMWEVELFYFAVKGSRVTAPEEGTGGEEPEGSKRPI